MSTKSTIYEKSYNRNCEGHKLEIHIYKEMHAPDDTIMVELSCSICNSYYSFLMIEHLGIQLAHQLQRGEDMPKEEE